MAIFSIRIIKKRKTVNYSFSMNELRKKLNLKMGPSSLKKFQMNILYKKGY